MTQTLKSGKEVGKITVDGVSTTLYCDQNTNTDTKNTAGSTDSSSKLFLVGATTQSANPQTYSHDTEYVGTDGKLYSGGKQTLTVDDVSTAGKTGSYTDLTNKPTIPSVGNATLTIQKNGTSVATFSANATTNATANITSRQKSASWRTIPDLRQRIQTPLTPQEPRTRQIRRCSSWVL